MDWSYIAGYFDGEGTVGHHKTASRSRYTTHLTWYNTHLESLRLMQEFMGCGNIHEKPVNSGRLRSWMLTVSGRESLLRVIDEMLPHLIIKRERAEKLRYFVEHNVDARRSKQIGSLTRFGQARALQMYLDGISVGDIARAAEVSPSAISNLIKKHGVHPRPHKSRKGIPKSPETRARMKKAQAKKWEDPEFRKLATAKLVKNRRGWVERLHAARTQEARGS